MAKRPPASRSQSHADDAAAEQPPAKPRPRRTRSAATANPADAAVAATMVPPDDVVAAGPTEDDIRKRAYQRYVERGGGHGMDFEDWLEAERELKSQKSKARSSEV